MRRRAFLPVDADRSSADAQRHLRTARILLRVAILLAARARRDLRAVRAALAPFIEPETVLPHVSDSFSPLPSGEVTVRVR